MESIYSNCFEMAIGPFDTVVVFGVKKPEQYKQPTPEFQKHITVYMSHEHTKSFLVVMKEIIDKYESKMGDIPIPPDYQARYDKLFNQININQGDE